MKGDVGRGEKKGRWPDIEMIKLRGLDIFFNTLGR
jgi:hypothetical protein